MISDGVIANFLVAKVLNIMCWWWKIVQKVHDMVEQITTISNSTPLSPSTIYYYQLIITISLIITTSLQDCTLFRNQSHMLTKKVSST
jgi:hypothetical protein